MIEHILPSKSNNTEFLLADLEALLRETLVSFSESQKFAQCIVKELEDVDHILHDKLGENHLGSFGLGYPFYAKVQDGFVKVDEINNFIENNLIQIKKISSKEGISASLACIECQAQNNLPDLRSVCSNCDRVNPDIKPRKVLKMLPDMDILIVLRSVDDDTLHDIQTTLNKEGYVQSDISIKNALESIKDVLSSLKNGKNTNSKIPIDLHVVSYKQFNAAFNQIQNGEKALIKSKALHMTWEDYDLPFWFDFVFSATELGSLDEELKDKVLELRKIIKRNYSEDELINELRKNYPRAQRILDTKEIEISLRNKIKSW